MAAFQAIIKNCKEKFDGTAIRVPLRNRAQAAKSEISSRETTVSEVSEVLRKFASEFGDSGLLFMRNIEKLVIKSETLSVEIEMANANAIRK